MSRIKNTDKYPVVKPSLDDYFIGSKQGNNGKTVNFDFRSVVEVVNENSDSVGFSDTSLSTALLRGGYYNTQGYDYFVWANSYVINGVKYSDYISDTIALEESDLTFDRIDIIVVRSEGIGVIKGTAALNPSAPVVDESLELQIGLVLVKAASTEDESVVNTSIYNENLQESGGEWDTAPVTNSSVNGVVGPSIGSNHIILSQGGSSNVRLSKSSPILVEAFTSLVVSIKRVSKIDDGGALSLLFVDSSSGEQGKQIMINSLVGFDSNNIDNYQTVTISSTLLTAGNFTVTKFDSIYITKRGASEFYVDNMFLQSGTTPSTTPLSISKTSQIVNDGADGTSTFVEHKEIGAVAISNDYNDLSNKPMFKSIQNSYADMAALYSAQANQSESFIQYVADASAHPDVEAGSAYFEYLGTTEGDETDYRLLSNAESAPISVSNKLSISEIIVKDKSQIINQVLDSTKIYKIDSQITLLDGESIIVPEGGLTLNGHGFNISTIFCSAANHTMFTSPVGGSGDLILSHIEVTTVGANSKVFDINDSDGNHAIEIEYVNFSGCTSLGKQDGYRQGTWTTVGVYGCDDGLQLSGTWNGYKVSNSNCFGFGATGTLFKKDADTSFNNRLFLNVNADFPTGAVLCDFDNTNFSANELFQINSSIAKLNGSINIDNTEALVPNISANDLKSLWVGNIGLADSATEALVEDNTVTGNYNIDWLKDTYFLTMTGDTTFTESNLPASTKNTQEIKLYLTGNFTPTFPANWETNMVGTYKGADVNEISVKYIRNGVYFVKISNTLTVYPAPILGTVSPVSVIPNSTNEVILSGSFYTPQGFVLIDEQVVNSIDFDPVTGNYILSVTSGATEGEFDIVISNGTRVTFVDKFIVNLGEVFIPTFSEYSSVSGSIDLTVDGLAKITNPTVTGTGIWNKVFDISNDFEFRFSPRKSNLNPDFGNFLTRNYIRFTDSGNSDVYECRLSVYATYVQTAWTKNGTYVLNKTTTNGTTPDVRIKYDGVGLYMSVNGSAFETISVGALSGNFNNMRISLADLDVTGIKYIELP